MSDPANSQFEAGEERSIEDQHASLHSIEDAEKKEVKEDLTMSPEQEAA